jgi:ankyrin repeat protein
MDGDNTKLSKSARKVIVAVEEPDSDEEQNEQYDSTPPPSVIPEGPQPVNRHGYVPGQSHVMAGLSPRGVKSLALPATKGMQKGPAIHSQSLGNFADLHLNYGDFHSERMVSERTNRQDNSAAYWDWQESKGIGESNGGNSLDISDSRRKGNGMLASPKDLALPAEEFALGCKLLQQAALGNKVQMEMILKMRPKFVNFRDYDRRTALHVAASEGHLEICKFLVKKGAKINRSDRWGGSPLDDAHRHRHEKVVIFLREKGGTTGSANNTTNLITAAADGDLDEVRMLLAIGNVNLNEGDYDRRTALHLAAGEGHVEVVELLCEAGANVNATDRWGFRPLDDARSNKHNVVIQNLLKHGAEAGSNMHSDSMMDDSSRRRERANLEGTYAIEYHVSLHR